MAKDKIEVDKVTEKPAIEASDKIEVDKVTEKPAIEASDKVEEHLEESDKETRVTVVVNSSGGPWPTTLFCSHCQSYVTSEINPITSTRTHIIFLLMCLVGCCLCAPFAYCNRSCMAKEHYCPVCRHRLSVYDG